MSKQLIVIPLKTQKWFHRPSQVRRTQQNGHYLEALVFSSAELKIKIDVV